MPAGQRDLLRTVVRELSVTHPDVMAGEVANPFVADVLADLAQEAAMPTLAASAWPRALVTAALERDDARPRSTGTLKLPSKVPAWVDALPPLVVDGMRLDDELTGTVLGCAVRQRPGSCTPRPLVAARERMRGKDRDAFALPLMSAFLTNGGKPADRAWFMAGGYLGAEGFVHALTPMVREWPGSVAAPARRAGPGRARRDRHGRRAAGHLGHREQVQVQGRPGGGAGRWPSWRRCAG